MGPSLPRAPATAIRSLPLGFASPPPSGSKPRSETVLGSMQQEPAPPRSPAPGQDPAPSGAPSMPPPEPASEGHQPSPSRSPAEVPLGLGRWGGGLVDGFGKGRGQRGQAPPQSDPERKPDTGPRPSGQLRVGKGTRVSWGGLGAGMPHGQGARC